MAKKKHIVVDYYYGASIKKFSTDPLKFGIEILKWFGEEGRIYDNDGAEEWEEEWIKVYEEDNSKIIEDCIEEITNEKIQYGIGEPAVLFSDNDGTYIKEYTTS